jgi:hypothetical protein
MTNKQAYRDMAARAAPIASTDRPGPMIPEGSTRLTWSVHSGRTTLPLDDLTIIGVGWPDHLLAWPPDPDGLRTLLRVERTSGNRV